MRERSDEELLRDVFDARAEGDAAYLIESLRRDPENVTVAADALARLGDAAAVPSLLRLLDRADPRARRAALHALEKLGAPEDAKERISQLAVSDPDRATRSWACVVLGNYGDRAFVPLLVDLLDADDWRIRNGAAGGLAAIGDASALPALRAARKRARKHPIRGYTTRSALKNAIRMLERR